jgi:hypothetical protein
MQEDVEEGIVDAQAGQAALPKKSPGIEDGDHRCLALRRDDGELHLPLLDIKHHVGSLALRKDRALLLACHDGSSSADFGEKRVRIECVRVCHHYPLSLGGATRSGLLFSHVASSSTILPASFCNREQYCTATPLAVLYLLS